MLKISREHRQFFTAENRVTLCIWQHIGEQTLS